jgi:WD40 repeat protein
VGYAERKTDWRRLARRRGWNALSPDGKKVLSRSTDGAVRLWDIDTDKVIAKWLGHTAGVTSLGWSRDGQRVVGGSYNRARFWDAEN